MAKPNAPASPTRSPQEQSVEDSRKAAEKKAEKQKRFKEQATARMGKALHSMERVAALSSKRSYDYEQSQVDKIIKALEDMTARIKRNFSTGAERVSDFEL